MKRTRNGFVPGVRRVVRLFLVDDHPVILAGLRQFLSSDDDLVVAGWATSGLEAIRKIKRAKPDLVIMDVRMRGLDGIETTRVLLQNFPRLRVIAFSGYDDPKTVAEMIQAGARGYVDKADFDIDLAEAIRIVHRGGTFFSRAVSKHIRGEHLFVRGAPLKQGLHALTACETKVLELVARGLCNKDMAIQLEASVRTIEKHRETLMSKLALHGVADLTRFAIRHGIVPVD